MIDRRYGDFAGNTQMYTPTNTKILCDTCHDEYIFVPVIVQWKHGMRLASDADISEYLAEHGWKTVGGRHLCPVCRNGDVT